MDKSIIASRSSNLPADRHPVAVYLASLSKLGGATMRSALRSIVYILTDGQSIDLDAIDWVQLRFQHASLIRSKLSERYSPATANKTIAALRGVMKAAWELDYISAEDYQRIKGIKGVGGSTLVSGRALTEKEIAALLQVCADDLSPAGVRDGVILVLLRAGGLRRAEICSIKLPDYDPVNQTLVVHGKGNKERELPITPDMQMAINDWLAVRGSGQGALFCPVNKSGKAATGKGLSPTSIYVAIRKRAVQAGVKKFTPHDFRRTFASDLLDSGADISIVQKLLGHSQVTTTQRYDRRGAKVMRKAVEMIAVPYKARG